MDAARAQLVQVGAAGLSLREVAREVGMVSSAVYRYVASRDELLTRLIIEAYDALGAVAEAAVGSSDGSDLDRWVAGADAIRAWAVAHPQQYLLLYGTPVPGYAAPADTIGPGVRVTLALLSVVRDAATGGRLVAATDPGPLPGHLRDDLARLQEQVDLAVDAATTIGFLAAWTQLFGLIGFELTNQTRGVATDHAALVTATARAGAHTIGLR